MNAEYFCLKQQLTVDFQNSNFEQIPDLFKLLTSGSIPDLHDLEQST
jgi:hypothetical protein